MKTLFVAAICLGLGAGIVHAEDIAKTLGEISKTPSKEETRAELQPIMDKMDVDGLQATLVDYAHEIKILQEQAAKSRSNQQKFLKIIKHLRSEVRAPEAN